MKTAKLYLEHGISAATFCGWKSKLAAWISEAQRLKALEDEDRRFKLYSAYGKLRILEIEMNVRMGDEPHSLPGAIHTVQLSGRQFY